MDDLDRVNILSVGKDQRDSKNNDLILNWLPHFNLSPFHCQKGSLATQAFE